MTISPSVLLSEGDAGDRANYSSSSITPTPNRVLLVGLAVLDVAGGTAPAPVLTGCGLTWSAPIVAGPVAFKLYVWHAFVDPALVTPGALTATGVVTAATADGAIWHVLEVDGVNPTTTNGVRQGIGGTTTADTIAVTLGAFANAANGTVAFGATWDSAGGTTLTITPGSGFTMVGQLQLSPGGSEAFRIGAEYRVDNDTTPDITVPAANDRVDLVGLELDGTPWTPPVTSLPIYPQAIVIPA